MRTFALIAYFFVACFLTHQQLIHEVSLTVADGYYKTNEEKKTICQTTLLYHGIFRCPFCTFGVVCIWWFCFMVIIWIFHATIVLDYCILGCVCNTLFRDIIAEHLMDTSQGYMIGGPGQGCISCGILVSGIRARGVSSEHIENMEMFSCSPT